MALCAARTTRESAGGSEPPDLERAYSLLNLVIGQEGLSKGRPCFVEVQLGIHVFLDQDAGCLPSLEALDCPGQLLLRK